MLAAPADVDARRDGGPPFTGDLRDRENDPLVRELLALVRQRLDADPPPPLGRSIPTSSTAFVKGRIRAPYTLALARHNAVDEGHLFLEFQIGPSDTLGYVSFIRMPATGDGPGRWRIAAADAFGLHDAFFLGNIDDLPYEASTLVFGVSHAWVVR